MPSFNHQQSISHFQKMIYQIYGLADDRLFSLSSLVANQSRFTMRAIKGIRKNNKYRLKLNIIIAFAWTMAIANRLHIDMEEEVWKRFPRLCSYCGQCPCVCKIEKMKERTKIQRQPALRPSSVSGFQQMFEAIYPSGERTLADAGVHLAEEVGEVLEVVNFFKGEHKQKQFWAITLELADWISCMFGVANSAGIDVARELERLFHTNCHVCHESPCVCSYTFVAQFRS